ncbi:MAG: hypothetical protein Q7U57_05715 [Methylovulum sp.]|nr:hypothetical protein [Methylovulum sp.]
MTASNISTTDPFGYERALTSPCPETTQVQSSAVSWGAIIAGAAAAASLSLILLMLGIGLGLSSVSPWAYNSISASAFGISTILWLAFTQIITSGMGGYLAGRLRTKWIAVHTDEVFFRDTAHGFLAWAVASLATAALLTSVIGAIVSGGIQVGADVAVKDPGSMRSDRMKPENESLRYFVDSLFRTNTNVVATTETFLEGALSVSTTHPTTAEPTSEVSRIFKNAILTGSLPQDDMRYVGQMVAQRTRLTQQDAEQRVNNTYAQLQTKQLAEETTAKNVADAARKTSVYASLWIFISLLIGAFIASLAAIYGGRMRDL